MESDDGGQQTLADLMAGDDGGRWWFLLPLICWLIQWRAKMASSLRWLIQWLAAVDFALTDLMAGKDGKR